MSTGPDDELGRVGPGDAADAAGPPGRTGSEEPDVLLDVSELRVDEISLEVENLQARVALQADVLELLKLHVGVDAVLGRVQLTIKGVEAKALLKVRLDNVARILDRVLTTIDNNPEIVERLTEQVGDAVKGAGEAVGAVGSGAAGAVENLGGGAGEAVGAVGAVGGGAAQAAERVTDKPARRRAAKRPPKARADRQRPTARRPRERRSEDE